MTDTQSLRLSTFVAKDKLYIPDDKDARDWNDDEVPHEHKVAPTHIVSRSKRRAKSEKAEKHQEPITPEKPTPKPTTSPVTIKPHSSRLDLARATPYKMYQKDAYASLALELEGAILYEKELVSKALPQPFDLDDILNRLSPTGGTFCRYLKASKKWNGWPPTHLKNKEFELGEYLNGVADDVRTLLKKEKSENDLVFSSQYRFSGPITKHTTQRKPDLVVIPRSGVGRKDLSWRDFRSIASLKIASQTQNDEREQLSEYARICFEEQYDRRYYIAFGLRHTNLTFYVFDRSGVLYSREHDVHKEPLVFLRVAISILFMDKVHLGYDPSFSTEKGKKCLTVRNQGYFIMGTIFTDRSIRGRGTVCLKVVRRKGEDMGKVCAVKDSFVDRSRQHKEHHILAFLNECKIKNVPELIAHEIVHVADESGQMVMDSTERFRGPKTGVEIRDHHRLVMYPCGESLKSFSSLPELMGAIRDVLQTIKDLNERGILHRDISIGNIVLVKDGPGYRKGYLIDFDFAIENTMDRIISEARRSGTLPYMASDVLAKTGKYTALLDAESTLYVLIWLTFTQAGPNMMERLFDGNFNLDDSILRMWNPEGLLDEVHLNTIADSKRLTMENEVKFKEKILEKMHPYFRPISLCLELLRLILFDPAAQKQPVASKRVPENLADFYRNFTQAQVVQPDPDKVLDRMIQAIGPCLAILENAEGTPTSESPAADNTPLDPATDVVPAVKAARVQSAVDVSDDPFSPAFALSRDGKSQPQTISEVIGSTKLGDHLKEKPAPRMAPVVKQEALRKQVLRSQAMRSVTAGDSEAPPLAPALDQPQESRSAGSYFPAPSPSQSLGKRSREDTNLAVPTVSPAQFYGEPVPSRMARGPPSPKLRKTF